MLQILQFPGKIDNIPSYLIFITMVFYRVVRHIEDGKGGTAKWSTPYESLHEAYSQCVLEDESQTCRRLLYGVQLEIKKGETFIRVTCDKGNVWWIQILDSPNDPVGSIAESMAKIDCCHARN